jgi:uncharacterized protein YjhX (UPF0386 family)
MIEPDCRQALRCPRSTVFVRPHGCRSRVFLQLNISKPEQRVLHALAQGGYIKPLKDEKGRIAQVECFNRNGWLLPRCTLPLFKKLRSKGAIASHNGSPYQISRRGLELVRSQLDNR